MISEFVQKTDLKRKIDKLYFIDSDGDLCEAVMCGIIDRDENGIA